MKINVAEISSEVIKWFVREGRDLPWRRTCDPYAIWVSEVMLQQTQVKTVIPYWERWMKELPTITALAQAKPEKALKLWEGLGYYRRARALQQAAIQMVQKHDGKFPVLYEEVLDLPGIGPYTAGAICSIAFNQPTAIVDGNIERVLSRLQRIQKPVESAEVKARIWKLSDVLVRAAAALEVDPTARTCSALNQGLMELGATICLPTQPRCNQCPVQNHCKARQRGDQESYPRSAKRITYTERFFVALIIQHESKYLVRQRTGNVVNSGLWEFPNWEVDHAQGKKEFFEAMEIAPHSLPQAIIKHTITRYRITMEVYEIPPSVTEKLKVADGHWKGLKCLGGLPFSSAHGRIRALLTSR